MEQFSLEKYLENPDRKIVTRDGRSVRVLCAQYGKPLLANVMEKDGRETTCGFILENGKYYGGRNDAFDLFFAILYKSAGASFIEVEDSFSTQRKKSRNIWQRIWTRRQGRYIPFVKFDGRINYENKRTDDWRLDFLWR